MTRVAAGVDPVGQPGLRLDALGCIGRGGPATDEPCPLDGRVARDQPDLVA